MANSPLGRQLAQVQGQVQAGLGNLLTVTLRKPGPLDGDNNPTYTDRTLDVRVERQSATEVEYGQPDPAAELLVTVYDPDVFVEPGDIFVIGSVDRTVRTVEGLLQSANGQRYVSRARVV